MKPIQSRMARAALGLGVREIASIAGLSPDTVARFERGDELRARTVHALREAFERTGVKFTNGGVHGVQVPNELFSAVIAIVIYLRIHRNSSIDPSERLDQLLDNLEALAGDARSQKVTYVQFESIYDEMKALGAFATNDMVSAVARACND